VRSSKKWRETRTGIRRRDAVACDAPSDGMCRHGRP
jgi:hypothetical protein